MTFIGHPPLQAWCEQGALKGVEPLCRVLTEHGFKIPRLRTLPPKKPPASAVRTRSRERIAKVHADNVGV
ncbi:hypothetical protein, partial [Streptomyces sp. 1222.5]|uniref:hypothetical protein n=1 Tax=Streptomyces sp. 1222.5 TaxID=1881026 RepID=UPI003EB7480A